MVNLDNNNVLTKLSYYIVKLNRIDVLTVLGTTTFKNFLLSDITRIHISAYINFVQLTMFFLTYLVKRSVNFILLK